MGPGRVTLPAQGGEARQRPTPSIQGSQDLSGGWVCSGGLRRYRPACSTLYRSVERPVSYFVFEPESTPR